MNDEQNFLMLAKDDKLLEHFHTDQQVKLNCLHYQNNDKKTLELIQHFFSLIKSMLFLQVTDRIDEYYNRFEMIIKEKNLNWQKFIYIKKIFEFRRFYQNKKKTLGDIKNLLEMIYEDKNSHLCIHDHTLIMLLLESFQDIRFIKSLVFYFHSKKPELAKIYIPILFLRHFYTKFDDCIQKVMKKIRNHKFFDIENFSFIHYLNSENILKIEKPIYFKFYQRLRYEILRDPAYKKIFLCYISKGSLSIYYIRFTLFYSIIKRFRRDGDSLFIVKNFLEEFKNSFFNDKIFKGNNFFYEILLFVYSLEISDEIGDYLLELFGFFEKRLKSDNFYHFSILCSLTGNLFFKNKFFDYSVRFKKLAFLLMQRVTSESTKIFPSFFERINLDDHLYSILSFITINQIRLNKIEDAEKFIQKIKNENFVTSEKQLEIYFFDCLKSLAIGKKKQPAEFLGEAEAILRNGEFTDLKFDLYVATLENLKLEFMKRYSNTEQIDTQRRKSRASVDKLYHNIIREEE